MNRYILILLLAIVLTGGGAYVVWQQMADVSSQEASMDASAAPVTNTSEQANTQIANPASVNCTQTAGGTLEIVATPDGQQGMCHLPDGTVCEEWALMRGECGAATSTVSKIK